MTDSTLQQAAEELAVRGQITRLSALTDNGDLDEYQSLFTEDAVWLMEAGPGQPEAQPIRGAATIRAAGQARRDQGLAGPGSHKAHVTVVNHVSVDGDKATALSYMTFLVNTDTKPEPAIFRVYHDVWVRAGGGWKLSVRTIEPL